MTGTIKRKAEKGFGFIRPDEGTKDIFFHMTGLDGIHFDDLNEGNRVEFEVEDSEKGPRAIGIVFA